MTRRCELTGKLPMSGNLRSHALNKTRRKFRPNLCNVTLMSETLKQGSKGEAVSELQNKLVKLGWTVDADGAFGAGTKAA